MQFEVFYLTKFSQNRRNKTEYAVQSYVARKEDECQNPINAEKILSNFLSLNNSAKAE